MRTATALLLAVLVSVLAGSTVLAQTGADDAAPAPKAFLSMDLAAGFPLDPFVVSVNGGGEVDAATLDEACVGFISEDPIFSVNWTGEIDAFNIFYYSDFDPTLVLQLPDGSYLCNDDAGDNLLDPELTVETPAEGQYKLWVGSYDEGQLIPGFLVITANRTVSVNDFDPGALVERSPIADELQPADTVGEDAVRSNLTRELAPDVTITGGDTPVTATLEVTGEVPVFTVLQKDDNGVACSGLVGGAEPDFIFSYTGDADALRVFFEGSADSSLVVAGEELVLCSDDSAEGENGNPVVDITAPAGMYGVWVGRFDPEESLTGTLTIAESTDTEPVQLEPIQPSADATETP